jgi:hypothetical protein
VGVGPGRGPVEITVFIPDENDGPRTPLQIAREMVESLHIGRAEFGVDLLTTGCEVRMYYEPAILDGIRAFLRENCIIHDISLL